MTLNREFWQRYDSAQFNYDDPEESVAALVQSFTGSQVSKLRSSREDLGAPSGSWGGHVGQ